MKAAERRALTVIRDCVAAERFVVLKHFAQRMDERGLFWADIQEAIARASSVRGDGHDDFGRARWILRGTATDGLELEIVCVLDTDEQGKVTVFITVYWTEGRS